MQSIVNKPTLSFWQLWNMSFGFFGIQFGFALQNANTSRIFSTLGALPDDLPLFWLAAPVTGLLVQPIIGYLSDRTWHPTWGRRRPFFFIGALLASFALLAMPHASAIWMAVVVLWLMDAAINVSMEPFRAFVGDKLAPSQQTAGFAMQTFFIGCGAVIASLLPTFFSDVMGVSNVSLDGGIPDTVRYSFYAGGSIYFLAVLWTVISSEELPPQDMQKFEQQRAASKGIAAAVREMVSGFMHMPETMIKLAVVQFFTWIALFAMWIYTTTAIAEHIFATTNSQSSSFQEAGNWVGTMFAVYNGVSALAAFLLPVLAKRSSKKLVHMLCLLAGGAGLISIYFIHTQLWLLLPMLGMGLAWASILTMPYALLASSLPQEKMGYYMGVFNFFIVIPQIVSGLLLGWVTRHWFGGQTVKTLMLGGACMIVAGLLSLMIKEEAAA
ncbi:MFS transporter [Undibacterium crateris]|uniref:MFS transporter n=1 Tax=Undibacterium crateris TaxID=2528175 RepID=UPI00138A593D|nr:MFS transporter [Undibacterium crateris]NDI86316.1 MFS transporter [Undibacterium crateris]